MRKCIFIKTLILVFILLLSGCATGKAEYEKPAPGYEQQLAENMAYILSMKEGLETCSEAFVPLLFAAGQFQDAYSTEPEVFYLVHKVESFLYFYNDLTTQNLSALEVYGVVFSAHKKGTNTIPSDNMFNMVERTDKLVSDLQLWYSLMPQWLALTDELITTMKKYGFDG